MVDPGRSHWLGTGTKQVPSASHVDAALATGIDEAPGCIVDCPAVVEKT